MDTTGQAAPSGGAYHVGVNTLPVAPSARAVRPASLPLTTVPCARLSRRPRRPLTATRGCGLLQPRRPGEHRAGGPGTRCSAHTRSAVSRPWLSLTPCFPPTRVAHTLPEAELTHDEALAVLRECGSGWLGDRREGTGGACGLPVVLAGCFVELLTPATRSAHVGAGPAGPGAQSAVYQDPVPGAGRPAGRRRGARRNHRVCPGLLTAGPLVQSDHLCVPPGYAAALAWARRRCASSWR